MKHSDYLKKKKTRETRKKIISVFSAIVVFVTTYALVLPAITLDVSRASREPGIAYEQMQFKATASAASVTAADSTVEEAQVEEPAAEEAAEEETIEEEAAEIPEEETSAVSDENEKEEAEQVVEEAPAESAREEAPAAEAEEVQEEEDKSAEEKADAEPSSEPAQEEAQTAETQKSADQAAVDQSGKSGTQATEAAAAASTEETAAEFQIPTLDPIDFDEILTGKTDFYFYHVEKTEEDENITSDSVDDWKKVSSDTVLAPEDFVRVYLSYEIPAGSLNETNAEARYRLPAGLELSDKQIKDINKYENGIAASKSGREHDKYLGAEAIEGSRTPNEKAGDEYISATVKVEKTNDGGQELVFTFIPYTVEKNQISYDEAGKLTSEGRNVKGFFTFDLTTAQIDFEKTEKETVEKEDGTKEEIQYSRAEVVFVKENNKKNIDEISRILTMAGPSEKEEPQVQEPKTLISKGEGNDYTVTVSYTDDAQIPDNAELAVREIEKGSDEYASYLEQAKGAVDENKSVNEARFFDITIMADGEKVEPQAPVNVQINFNGIVQTNTDDTQLLHYKDENEVEIMEKAEFSKSEEPENETKAVDTVQFETDGFSVYGIVGTETISTQFITADGKTLSVTATFDAREVLPKDAVLEVSEVTYEDDPEAYAKRNERLAGALYDEYGNVAITDVRYLNISIMVPDENASGNAQNQKEYEPSYPVKLKVEYTEPMDTTNPGEYTDYNDGSKQFIPDIGNHIVGVHYTENGTEFLKTVDEDTNAGITETVTNTDGFSEYDFAYIYEYEIKDTDYDYEPSAISKMSFDTSVTTKAAADGLLRGAGDTPAHTKTLGDNHDGTHKLSLTVTGDADTNSNVASNANIIIVFDVSNSMVNYKVPVRYGTHGSDDDGENVFQLYSNTSGTAVTEGYTGTVYRRTRNGNRWVYSVYTGQRYSGNIRRADAAEKVIYDFAHALYGYQNDDDPATPEDESENIQTALITFNRTASTAQGWTSTENDITGKVSSTGAANSKKLGNGSGTNWQAAMQAAETMVSTADDDPTFVVFITDGQPTQINTTPSGTYITDGTPYVGARDDAYDVQQACAATGTDTHGALFGIYAYGTEADYLDDMMYYAYNNKAVHTEDLAEAGEETFETEGYYNAGDSEALAAAVNDIFSKIVKTLGITAVSISDGTTSQVQTTSGEISHLLEVDTGSYDYWLSINTVDNKFKMKDLVSGADVEYTVSSSGSNVTISWTKDGNNYSETYEGTYSAGTARIKWDQATSFYNYAPPAATFTDPKVDWNLSSVGTLLDGVTYEVTFDVFPSQYTLDLIADLKNGYVEYDDLDANIQAYLVKDGNDYVLKTNTNATISYTDTRTDAGPQTTGYVNPDPVSTSATDALSITKDWSNDVDGHQKPDELLMHVTRDETDRYELVLNDADHWQDSSYISFGIVTVHNGVISVKTPGHDFSFSEPPEMEYYWEMIVPIIRPMKINGVDTMLVKVDAEDAPSMSGDNATAVGSDGYTYYKLTINGTAMYYRVDNSVASLHAENHRRSYLQVVKSVQDPKEGDTFDFTSTITNSNAASGSEDDLNSDYWVWFSVYDTVGCSTVISDDLATGEGLQREIDSETGDYTGYYYIPSGNTVTIKMQNGYSLRFLNLPTGSTYSISETLDGNYELVSIDGTRNYKEEEEGEDGSTTIVDKSEETGTVEGLGISGTIDYADSRYEIDYTNKRIVTEASAKKEWENADGTTTAPQGAQVTYTLYADGTATNYRVVLDGTADEEPTGIGCYESEGWTATFVNQPKYKVVDDEKVEIEYTIAETTTYPGYTPSTTGPVADGGTITNTQEATTAYALKAWENADGTTTAPADGQVTYTLYADDTATSYTVTLDGTVDDAPEGTGGYESEAWKAEFVNLPKYQAGTTTEIEYTIAETTTYPGYTASTTDPVTSGETITNTQGSTDTYAVKAWKNADGSETAPEGATVVFTLYADGTATDYTVTLDGTADTAPSRTGGYESEAWKATFVKLPRSKIVDGKLIDIVYSIAETTTYPGYTASTTEPVGLGSTITNSQDPTSANALKAWKNADGSTTAPQAGQVTYTLYADGTATEYTVTLDGTPETAPEGTGGYESEAWKAEFVNLPKYQAGTTTEIVYTIAETTTYPGYTASTEEPVASGETITNTQEETDANALKAWKNADGSTTPPADATVVFKLYADGEPTDYTVTLDGTAEEMAPTVAGGYESEAWKAMFIKLPKYKVVEGKAVEIVYTIGESVGYSGYTADPANPVSNGETITNKQDDIDVYATKIWQNADGAAEAPEDASVVFTLFADDTPTEYTVTLDGTADETVPNVTGGFESEAWKASFVHLPKYQADGETEIVYTIAETTGYEGYKASTTEAVESGASITNSQLSAKIKLLKIGDGKKDNTLDGVQFELYSTYTAIIKEKAKDVFGNEIGTITTASGGKAEIGNLLPGTYYLVETKAADGYKMLSEPVEIYIQLKDEDPGYTVSYKQTDYSASGEAGNLEPDEDGAYEITVNNPSGVELPMTGGSGTLLYTLSGLVLILGAAMMYGFKMRRRERRLN